MFPRRVPVGTQCEKQKAPDAQCRVYAARRVLKRDVQKKAYYHHTSLQPSERVNESVNE